MSPILTIPIESDDPLIVEASNFVHKEGRCSASLLQRHFRIGYPRAARLLDELEKTGVIARDRTIGGWVVLEVYS